MQGLDEKLRGEALSTEGEPMTPCAAATTPPTVDRRTFKVTGSLLGLGFYFRRTHSYKPEYLHEMVLRTLITLSIP